MSTPNVSQLRQLVNIISDSVDRIEADFQQSSLEYPSLDMPYNPATLAETTSMSPDVRTAASLAVAACGQLSANLKVPFMTLLDAAAGFHVASALRVALESNTVEILRGVPQGLHARDIAVKNGMDPIRISRVLRLLASHHIFVETSPDVFANNRLSSMMDTLKSVEDIKANPEEKHVGTPGIGALIEHTGDEIFKGSAIMTEVLLDPITGHSDEQKHAPMAIAFKTTKFGFDWFEEPGNEFRLKRFAAAMAGSLSVEPPDAILKGFNWGSLTSNSVVVDVGGGIGHTSLSIIQQHPKLKIIVQDRPAVVKQGTEFWNSNLPSALRDGSVTLQAHDFFEPQPQSASVFLCRMIIHDYGKKKATEILRQLRVAAKPDTKLLLVDEIVPYACRDERAELFNEIPGAERFDPPQPLLANLGKANAIVYLVDFQMYVGGNGEERTLGTFLELTKDAGWKVVEIFTVPGSTRKQILAIPI